jgi:hypothetical protein
MSSGSAVPSLGVLQRWAAYHGRACVPLTETQRDRLDLLAELGGQATAHALCQHTGAPNTAAMHTRMMSMVRIGAVERLGAGKHGEPYRYRLTPVGEMMRVSS